MKNKKWSSEFPEVPEFVHQTVLDTLDGLECGKVRKVKQMKKRTVIILAAAMIAILGTTVSASEIFKWNEKANEVFEADEEQQKELVMEQVAQEEYQTITDAGLTIRAVQTIQDVNCFYGLFEITAEDDSIQIEPGNDMDLLMDYHGKDNPFSMLGCGFVDESRQEITNSRYYEIYGTKADASTEDLDVTIHFTSLNAPGEKAIEGDAVITGNWEFSLKLHAVEAVRYEINKEYQIGGCTVMVKEVELTPISMRLVCDEAGARELEKMEGVNIDQADSLRSLFINGVKYKDGTVVEEEGYQELSAGFSNGNYEKTARFSHVIDVDNASALLTGDNMEEIILP